MTLRRSLLGLNTGKRVGAGGALTYTPPLDIYNNSTAAFSVRLLRTAYAGPCMRIADSSDSQIDIGFDSEGLLDIAAIYAHVGSPGPTSNAYVVKWYDQSGNGNDLTAPTDNASRKQICFSTIGVFLSGGIPSLYGNNSGNGAAAKSMAFSSAISVGSLFISGGPMISFTTVSTIGWYGSLIQGFFTGGFNANATGWGVYASGVYAPKNTVKDTTNRHLWEYIHDGTNRNIWTDGANSNSYTGGGIQIIEIGRTVANGGGVNFTADCPIHEYIIFSDDKTSDRAGIETNINSYYSIY